MGSVFAQSMEMLDVTENMDSFHQPPMNMNLNMQPRQIPRQPHHQQQNNDPCEPVYANLSIVSPDDNSENINFFAHLPIDKGCKLNVHKTFRTSSERLMYVQFTSCVYWDNEAKTDFGAMGRLTYLYWYRWLSSLFCFQNCI